VAIKQRKDVGLLDEKVKCKGCGKPIKQRLVQERKAKNCEYCYVCYLENKKRNQEIQYQNQLKQQHNQQNE
jgi:hypothetical protein